MVENERDGLIEIDGLSDESSDDLFRLQRIGHVAVKRDKHIILWGGCRDVNLINYYIPTNEIWLYERITEKWQTVKTDMENCPFGNSGACGLVHDNKLYIFGGFCKYTEDDEGFTNEMYALDLVKLTWQHFKCDPARRPIKCNKMVGWTHEDNLFYFGGFGVPPAAHRPLIDTDKSQCQFCFDVMGDGIVSIHGWNNQLVVFDTNTQTWKWPSFKGPPPIPRAAHAASKVGDKVYIFGGRNLGVRMNDLHCLDLRTMTWSGRLEMKGPIPDGRSWHSLTAISDTLIVLYGGFSQQKDVFSDCWLLNLTTLTWTHVPLPFKKPRLWHTACIGDPGEVLIFGGCSGNILNPLLPKVDEFIITLRFSPMSLLRLSLNAVLHHKNNLETYWSHLPPTLLELVLQKNSPFTDSDK